MHNKKDVISFRKLIAPGGAGYNDHVLAADCTLEEILVFFAQGQEFALQITPMLIKAGTQAPSTLVTFNPGTDSIISGDNLPWRMFITRPAEQFDTLRIVYKNTDLVNSVHLSVDIAVDFYGGRNRVV